MTGQYEPQSIKKSVYQARVIPMEVLASKGAVRLQDVFNTELNIRFEQDPALGGSKLTMQGLSGQNVKVLIDGVPLVGRQGTGNEFDINQINTQSIERIEIIEGPMAVTYGADALAGVINIITKKAAEGKLELNARLHEETVGKEYGWDAGIHNQSVGAAFARNKFHIRSDFNRNFFGGWQGSLLNRDKQFHPKTQYLVDVLTGYTGDKLNVYYRADYLFENIYDPANFVSGEAIDKHYYSNRLMQQLQGAYTFSSKTQANAVLGYTIYGRETQTTTVDEATGDERLALGAGLQDVTKFNGLMFRGTVQHKWGDKFTLQPGIEVNMENGSGGRLKEGTQQMADFAFFISGEWKINSWLQIRPGIRMLHNTVYTAPPAIPSINAKIKLNAKNDLRISYGRGFRAPSLRELYFDFVDANHSIYGNPELEAEFSNSFNGSWNYSAFEKNGKSLSTSIGGFYNSVENLIDYAIGNGNAATFMNFAHAKTTGFTWNNTWKSRLVSLSAGMGFTGRYNLYSETQEDLKSFTWSPEIKANATINLQSKGITIATYYKFTGKTPFYEPVDTDDVHLAKTDRYHWADISVQKSFGKMFSVTAGSRNLFDVKNIQSTTVGSGAHTASGSRSIGSGRSYFMSITYSFNK